MYNHEIYEEVGLRIRAHRKNTGMTLSELSKQLNISVPTLSKYESGAVSISLDALLNICRVFNIEASALLPHTSTHPENVDVVRYEKFFEEIIYIYWFNGEQNRVRSALIDNRSASRMDSTLYLDIDDVNALDESTFIYFGSMNYSETGTVFLYANTRPPFDKMAVRIPSFALRSSCRTGLMTSLTYYYQNVAVKIIATSAPVKDKSTLLPVLKINGDDIKEIRRTNFFIV